MRFRYKADRPAWAVQVLLALSERGETQYSLASHLGLSPTHVTTMLANRNISPRIKTLYEIAMYLGLNPYELAKLAAADTMRVYIETLNGERKPRRRRSTTPRPANPGSSTEARPEG